MSRSNTNHHLASINDFITMTPVKKSVPVRKHQRPAAAPLEKGPEYMVQVTDPVALRRDVLESLREIILFIQGYERFRKLQEEKVATFSQLKTDVKELNSLLDYQLRKFFPKGKLQLAEKQEKQEAPARKERVHAPKPMEAEPEEQPEIGELDELESQLRDIESQLQGMK